eukprot:2011978-Prymnesium_polylepis.1
MHTCRHRALGGSRPSADPQHSDVESVDLAVDERYPDVLTRHSAKRQRSRRLHYAQRNLNSGAASLNSWAACSKSCRQLVPIWLNLLASPRTHLTRAQSWYRDEIDRRHPRCCTSASSRTSSEPSGHRPAGCACLKSLA